MSTHGRIGIVCDGGKVLSIYNHWDSYPSCLGKNLLENYKDKAKVEKLISLGDCSSVREEVDIPEGKIHTFDKPLDNVTVAYGRDRGETGVNHPRLYNSEKDFWEGVFEKYGYLFKDGKWFVTTSQGKYDKDGNCVRVEPKDRKIVELTNEVCKKED